MIKHFLTVIICFISIYNSYSQENDISSIPAEVDFGIKINEWDGFGFNYVETAQTRNYLTYHQDYGGFSLLSEKQKNEIIELVFGQSGLQVQIVKMFLDPFHQANPDGPFNHELTTTQMQAFVSKGLNATRKRGDDLEIITTLYGPPAWATAQKFIGGRDLDTAQSDALCNYMMDWVEYLKRKNYPVKYLSIHNEGEDFYRWDFEDGTQRLESFDYNLYWPPKQINNFLIQLGDKFSKSGINDVKLTNGEPSNWTRFYHWGYADALYNNDAALENLGLLTTHGFINGDMKKLSYGSANSLTTDLLRSKKPDLHTWITSYSWGSMGVDFMRMAHEHIYTAKVNALIPWAGIQNPSEWIDGDPNSGTAIRVDSTGNYEITSGYYFYKQLTRAGYRGMYVAKTLLANPQAFMIAFAQDKTDHPDAFVITSNIYIWSLPIEIRIKGSKYKKFRAYRSSENGNEKFEEIGIFDVRNGIIIYDPPQGSTTTFIGMH